MDPLCDFDYADEMDDIDGINDIAEIEENPAELRVPRRFVRDSLNPLEFYSEVELKRRYRFDKDRVLFGILPLIEEGLTRQTNRGLPIPPVMKLLITLRFYSTASFQIILGDTTSVSQPTVSRVVFRVSTLLASLMRDYIKMPVTAEAKSENRRLFKLLGYGNGAIGIPDVDGAIDCTHVRLAHTRFHNLDEIFRNRKGYFSLNVQTVVSPSMEFLDIVPEWPGSAHDSRKLQNSRIYMKYTQGELDGLLVGDAGYPCLPFLMTPVTNPQTDKQQTYNHIHSRTSQIVESTYGVWKRRFPCLSRGLTTKLLCSTTIVVAFAVLHNMAIRFRDDLPEEDEMDNPDEEFHANAPHWQPLDGFIIREALIERMFP